MTTTDDILRWRDRTAYDSNGDKIGDIKEIYLDEETGQPEWALINTGMFGTKSNFVPVEGGSAQGDDVRLQFTKDQVKNAPQVDADEELSPEEERRLYEHYSIDYDTVGGDRDRVDTRDADRDVDVVDRDRDRDVVDRDRDRDLDRDRDRGTVGHDTSGPETDNAMTRSEEELRVGKQRRETGKVRLRKYVETEHVTERVPVTREEVHVERETISDENAGNAMEGAAISEEEHEVTLHDEVAVADKKAVPKERVRVDKDVVTEEQEVDADLRKERIDVDENVERTRDR